MVNNALPRVNLVIGNPAVLNAVKSAFPKVHDLRGVDDILESIGRLRIQSTTQRKIEAMVLTCPKVLPDYVDVSFVDEGAIKDMFAPTKGARQPLADRIKQCQIDALKTMEKRRVPVIFICMDDVKLLELTSKSHSKLVRTGDCKKTKVHLTAGKCRCGNESKVFFQKTDIQMVEIGEKSVLHYWKFLVPACSKSVDCGPIAKMLAYRQLTTYHEAVFGEVKPKCIGCEEGIGTHRCSGCHLVKYCSVDCQKEHWNKGHRRECALARKIFM